MILNDQGAITYDQDSFFRRRHGLLHVRGPRQRRIRKAAGKVKKVTSSHSKGTSEVISEEPLDEAAVRQALEDIGYRVTGVESGPYEKKGLFSFGKK